MSKNKKSISSLIAAVLLVLLVIAAAIIIWKGIIPLINNFVEGIKNPGSVMTKGPFG